MRGATLRANVSGRRNGLRWSFLWLLLLPIGCESPTTDPGVAKQTSALTESDAAVADAPPSGASIRTDRSDYPPGATAYIDGSGFVPGERVTLQVTHSDGTAEGGAGHDPWDVIADGNGNLASEWYVNPDDSAGSSFLLTADSASGLHAETSFTDAIPCSVDANCPLGPPIGLFDAYCSNHQCQPKKQIGSLCSGDNECLSNNCLNGFCLRCTQYQGPVPASCSHSSGNGSGEGGEDHNVCTDDVCNFATGLCERHPNTLPCDDGNDCTKGDACSNGLCRHTGFNGCSSNFAFCSSNAQCQSGRCVLGQCFPCGNDLDCVTTDPCRFGSCVPEPNSGAGVCIYPRICDDANACTVDVCFAPSGAFLFCVNPNAQPGAPCDNSLFCDGTDTCNGSGTCNHTGDPCLPLNLSDNNCASSCSEVSKGCVAPDPFGTACNDGNACSTVDACQAGICVGGRDTTPPSIACPGPQSVECTSPSGAAVTFANATASDNCVGVTTSCAPASGSTFPLGSTSDACTATDPSNNRASCTFNVSVVDTTKPTVTVSGASSLSVECATPFSDPGATANDICAGNLPVTTSGIVDAASVGDYLLTYAASDPSGNIGRATRSITVVDTTPPTLICSAPITAECTGNASAAVSFPVSAIDSCVGALTPGCTLPSGSLFPLGTTTETCSASDGNGNSGSCGFDVSVVDTTPPVFDTTTPTTQVAAGNCAGAPIGLPTLPSASDGCQSPTVTCGTVAGNGFGSQTIRCTAKDPSGNTATKDYTLTMLEPLTLVFQTPLVGPPMKNPAKIGSTLPHKVKVLNCSNADVTVAAYVVKLGAALEVSGDGTISATTLVPSGVGDAGGDMYLVPLGDGTWVWQYNVKTSSWVNTTTGTYAGDDYKDTASVSYASYPGITFTSFVIIETTD
jgi:hypothetical protein